MFPATSAVSLMPSRSGSAHDVEVKRIIARDASENKNGKEKSHMNAHYMEALALFASRVKAARNKANLIPNQSIEILIQPGRKFDKLVVATLDFQNNKIDQEVGYFVAQKTGMIFGAKSNVAPNTRWFYGTVYNSDKWDWTNKNGVNVSDESVVEIGQYGSYRHYVPADKTLVSQEPEVKKGRKTTPILSITKETNSEVQK